MPKTEGLLAERIVDFCLSDANGAVVGRAWYEEELRTSCSCCALLAPTACGVRRCSDAVHGSLAVAKCDGALFVERAEAGRGSLADHA